MDLATAIAAARRRIAALEAGQLDDPRIHLRHAAEPQPPAETQRRVVAETWAALSVGLLIASLAIIIWFRILPPGVAVVAMFGSYLAIEAFFKRDVRILFLRLSLVVAFITVVILTVTFLREVLLHRAPRPRRAVDRRQPRRGPAPPPLIRGRRRQWQAAHAAPHRQAPTSGSRRSR